MSHGVPRTQQQHQTEEVRRKELEQIEQYRVLDSQVNKAVAVHDLSEQSLALTSKLLAKNPEYYTVWNHRRRILQHLFLQDSSSISTRLTKDLDFLLPILKKFPKCYWIWSHRMWLLAQASVLLSKEEARKFWQAEFALVATMLTRDNRNFHGWNYRRKVITQLQSFTRVYTESGDHGGNREIPEVAADETRETVTEPLCEKEFAYTTQMVRGNLSNFSAWHQRSMLIPQILNLRNASRTERQALFDSELAFIKDALFTDPYDQSLWFYHQYLMSLLISKPSNQIVGAISHQVCPGNRDQWIEFTNHDREQHLGTDLREIRDLLEDTDDCKWIYQSLLSLAESYLEVDGGNQSSIFTTAELRSWLGRLKDLDPLRVGRWTDWERKLDL